MQRAFTRSQRRRLWIESGSRCACCGGVLGADWEADHVYPWSLGGLTIIENAQALCRACNRRKGKNVINVIADNTLRDWQKAASDQTMAAFRSPEYANRAYFTVATMGAGKTRYAADVARRVFASGMCRQVIVIVPTLTVIKGWQDTMSKIGIELNDAWKGDRDLTVDFHGVIATYQSAMQAYSAAFANLASSAPTLLIADEVHHGGDESKWGSALERIGAACAHRLFLTGTPIRNDNRQIPMVEYTQKTDGYRNFYEVTPDYTYEYRDALGDEVVRPVRFHLEDSGVDFGVERGDDSKRMFSSSLMDRIIPPDESARLIAALDANEKLMRQMIAVGDERISELRDSGIVDAGGIITCLDIEHAKAVAKTVRLISGEAPTLVHNKDVAAREKIDAFRTSRKRWIVSVKMISEGVDIPRLAVGVMATNVVATLFFKQFVGRCIRRRDGEDIEAYIIAPKIPAYHDNAKEFEDAVRHHTQDLPQRTRDKREPSERAYVTTYATMPNGTTIVVNGVAVPPEFYDHALSLLPNAKIGEVYHAAYALYMAKAPIPMSRLFASVPTVQPAKTETAASRKARVRKERAEAVGKVIGIFHRLFPENSRPGAAVNDNFMRAWGNRKVDQLSIAEVEQQTDAARRIVRKMDACEHKLEAIQRKILGDELNGLRWTSDPLPDRDPRDPVARSLA